MSTEFDYKKAISHILSELNKKDKNYDINLRYIYRVKDLKEDETFKYYTERVEIKDDAKNKIFEYLREDFKNKLDEDVNIYTNYKLDQNVPKGYVGILREENYPEELKALIEAISQPDADPGKRRIKKTRQNNKIPKAFAIISENMVYIKIVEEIKIVSGKNMNKSLIFGAKNHKIQSVDQDFLLIVLTEPDFIVYNDSDIIDPTFVYNLNHFGNICASYEYMKKKIKDNRRKLEEIMDDPTPLLEYINKSWRVVQPFYFTLQNAEFGKLNPKYLDILEKKYFAGKISADASGRLLTGKLTGKEVYNILLDKYGTKLRMDGSETEGIVEVFAEIV